MRQIPIYKAEASVEGLADKVRASSSITYASQIKPAKDIDLSKVLESLSSDFMKAHAGIKDADLYPTRSILVSSNWNLNDDVFDKFETFAARNTPAHKPTNLGHDEHQLVGHMTDNWVIDEGGNLIADDTSVDELPDLFHIVNDAVIYTTWQDPALQERTQQLIADIEAGRKFVSMECLFSNFGYAIISPEGNYYTLARSEETAFLTKHLRAYGGSGVYEGYKLGRLPRNIVFSAKGYVDRPGNPNSIILPRESSFSFAQATEKNPFCDESGVSISVEDTHNPPKSREKTDMSDSIYKTQAEKAESHAADLQKQLDELKEAHTKAGFDKLETQVKDLEKLVADLTAERDELAAAKTELETAKTDAEAKVDEVTKARDELQTKVDEAEAAVKTAGRVAQLVEAGATAEEAAAKVEKFTNLDDDQWGVVAESLVAQFPPKKDDDKKKDDKKKDDAKAEEESSEADEEKDSADADEKSLDDAKAEEEASLATAGEAGDEELTQTRKDLVKAIAGRLGRDIDDEEESK